MKIKRRTTLGEALDEVAAVARRIRSGDTVEVDGRTFAAGDQVSLEIELEQEDGKAELEFEIKSAAAGAEPEPDEEEERASDKPDASRSRQGGGRAILGVVGGLLLGAALVSALRRRRPSRSIED